MPRPNPSAPPLGKHQKQCHPFSQAAPTADFPSGRARHHDLGPPDLRDRQRSRRCRRSASRASTSPIIDDAYRFDRDTTLAILAGFAFNRRVMIQGYHGTGKSTHVEQVACAAQLALHPRQSRQPHQPHRPGRQGRDRAARQQAGHRIPRGHPALGVAAPGGAVLRRIRRRPAGRHVRDPARARGRGQADPARPEPGHPAALRRSGCSRPPTRSGSATPPASITARSRSTRARWTAGTSSRR